jgi:hypothetical protein
LFDSTGPPRRFYSFMTSYGGVDDSKESLEVGNRNEHTINVSEKIVSRSWMRSTIIGPIAFFLIISSVALLVGFKRGAAVLNAVVTRDGKFKSWFQVNFVIAFLLKLHCIYKNLFRSILFIPYYFFHIIQIPYTTYIHKDIFIYFYMNISTYIYIHANLYIFSYLDIFFNLDDIFFYYIIQTPWPCLPRMSLSLQVRPCLTKAMVSLTPFLNSTITNYHHNIGSIFIEHFNFFNWYLFYDRRKGYCLSSPHTVIFLTTLHVLNTLWLYLVAKSSMNIDPKTWFFLYLLICI